MDGGDSAGHNAFLLRKQIARQAPGDTHPKEKQK
jgi:hypothetical protein